MTHGEFTAWLRIHGACESGQEWVGRHSYTPEQAWRECVEPDWLIWLAGEAGIPNESLLKAGAAVVRTVAADVAFHEACDVVIAIASSPSRTS